MTGVHRTWIDPATRDKAPVAHPRRAMGGLLGNGVRFGRAGPVMLAGEGLETVLSLKRLMSPLPMISALSAAHLGAVRFPPALRRLYVARESDPASDAAWTTLSERADAAGIALVPVEPMLDDANAVLRLLGVSRLRAHLLTQLHPDDAERFLAPVP